MTRWYLLDTNTVSYVIKGNVPEARRRLVRIPMGQVAVSAITEAELHYGVERLADPSRVAAVVKDFLLRVTVLPWDSAAATQYGFLRAWLERRCRSLGSMDLLIGAHALALGATLVSSDRAFVRIPNLTVEDWARRSR